ncbi:sulfite exporter TauE/SafE family protein [Riemerella anatipestifer]|uniref:sulfite exporter TauE/SafE family protein n=1 Tax=Riemerella anatipestifer TaxID=34085 RepID=UPI0013752846|nr:sulfite exporter TauE/SafE family protein [Riemerella anatipestifer]
MEITLIIAALTLGFTTGFHCIGMCGPIALSLGLSRKQQVNFHLQNITYQLGRIFTYSILGILLGLIGEGFQLAGVQGWLTIFAGIILIIMALFSFGNGDFASRIPFLSKFLLKIKLNLGKLLSKTDYSSRFLTGVLNGFLPCGMVYVALAASLVAGGAIQGGLFMMLFGLGTFPFMFVTVLLGNMLNIATRNKILKIMPVVMLILGGLFILRGLELGIPYLSPKKEALSIENKMSPKDKGHHSCH